MSDARRPGRRPHPTAVARSLEGLDAGNRPESVFCSDWAATYGTPYLEAAAAPIEVDVAPVVEDDGVLRAHPGVAAAGVTLVFVDGVPATTGTAAAYVLSYNP